MYRNPFIVTGYIEPEYFCDRINESERLVKSIVNGNNIVIISPRRMGKTGLIEFCYNKPEISNVYYTFFIDILHTSSLREFTYLLGKTIYDSLLPRSKKMANTFIRALKSISGKFGFDAVTNLPVFNIELGDIERPEYTLDEIFKYLENADRRCIVAIDEFQQIAKYPEKNIEALLRTYIQKQSNSNFIFAGSERHLMQEMFLSSARPFYLSADILELKAIIPEIYIPFITGHFGKCNKTIDNDTVKYVYDLFDGHTYYIQKTFNESFAATSEKLTGPYRIKDENDYVKFEGNKKCEGCSAFQLVGDSTWRVAYIEYSSRPKRYRICQADEYLQNFHSPVTLEGVAHPQHGSFMRLTKEEYDRLQEWSDRETERRRQGK